MEKIYLNLMPFFEGYVRNYRRLNMNRLHNFSMLTKRETDYYANLGEMLGFDVFVEDSKPNKLLGRSRPMDLSWWKWDQRISKENYIGLALHFERENLPFKDIETIDKLFSKTNNDFIPHNVIGIQNIEDQERIRDLNKLVQKRNKIQQSNVLMVYRFYDSEIEIDRVWAYHSTGAGHVVEERRAICKLDEMGYWFM
jgi:hypothetical protein